MKDIEKLKTALKSFIENDDIISLICIILEYDSSQNPNKGEFNFRELEKILYGNSKEKIKDALSLASHWRLILPSWRKGIRSLCWGDRKKILTKPTTRYEVLRVVEYLVDNALQTGVWDPEEGIRGVFNAITDIDSELSLKVIRRIADTVEKDYREEAKGDFPYYFIQINQLKKIFDEFGLTERKKADLWVVEMKATDVMSPEVNITFDLGNNEFGFELNPSLLYFLK